MPEFSPQQLAEKIYQLIQSRGIGNLEESKREAIAYTHFLNRQRIYAFIKDEQSAENENKSKLADKELKDLKQHLSKLEDIVSNISIDAKLSIDINHIINTGNTEDISGTRHALLLIYQLQELTADNRFVKLGRKENRTYAQLIEAALQIYEHSTGQSLETIKQYSSSKRKPYMTDLYKLIDIYISDLVLYQSAEAMRKQVIRYVKTRDIDSEDYITIAEDLADRLDNSTQT